MIPETLGHRVMFKFDDGDSLIVPIVAWNDEGRPMIANSKRLIAPSTEELGATHWMILDPPVVLTETPAAS